MVLEQGQFVLVRKLFALIGDSSYTKRLQGPITSGLAYVFSQAHEGMNLLQQSILDR